MLACVSLLHEGNMLGGKTIGLASFPCINPAPCFAAALNLAQIASSRRRIPSVGLSDAEILQILVNGDRCIKESFALVYLAFGGGRLSQP